MSHADTSDGKQPAPKAYSLGGNGTKYTSWRGLMFSILYKTGDQVAYPYAYVQQLNFNKSGKLIIEMPFESVVIEGVNLAELYFALVDHLVREIVEADVDYQSASKGEPLISSITSCAPNPALTGEI